MDVQIFDKVEIKKHFQNGFSKIQDNDFNGAILDFTNAIKVNSKYAVLYINRGWCRTKIGDNNGALLVYNYAVEIDSNNSMALNLGAGLKRDSGFFSDAIIDYNKAIQINPNVDTYYFNRAQIKTNLEILMGHYWI